MSRRKPPPTPSPSRLEGVLSDLLTHTLPTEPRATCSNCAMASKHAPEGDEAHFHPVLKCCTFVPRLPNFLVGEALADDTAPEGRSRLEVRITNRVGISPLGVAPSRRESRATRDMDEQSFGRERSHVCPYLQRDDGRCSVWKYRNSVCTTWFCKHEHGAVSLRYWDAAKEALAILEQALAQHCVLLLDEGRSFCLSTLSIDRGPSAPAHGSRDDAVDAAVYAKLWGAWQGREREFFVRSAKVVSALSPAEIARLGGAPLALALERVRRAQGALSDPRPLSALVASPDLTLRLVGRDAIAVSSYRVFDPLEGPKALLDVLPLFDGRPIAQVLRDVRRRTGLDVDEATLRQLVEFEVLREIE